MAFVCVHYLGENSHPCRFCPKKATFRCSDFEHHVSLSNTRSRFFCAKSVEGSLFGWRVRVSAIEVSEVFKKIPWGGLTNYLSLESASEVLPFADALFEFPAVLIQLPGKARVRLGAGEVF